MHAGPGKGRIIAMMNQKGGVGKTTTVANLGAALAELGAEVLLIDLDPQAHLTLHVGLNPDELDQTVYGLLSEPDLAAIEILQQVDTRLAVIGSEVDLAACESELVARPDRQTALKDKVNALASHFDYVFIDCPPSLGLLTLNALGLAGEVIVPMQAHFLALQGLSKLLETVQLIRTEINPALTVAGVILCMHDRQTTLAQEVVADLQRFFDAAREQDVPWRHARIFTPPVRRNIKLAECPSFGQTIFQYAPWCPGARDYRALAEAMLAADGLTDPTDRSAAAGPPARALAGITEPPAPEAHEGTSGSSETVDQPPAPDSSAHADASNAPSSAPASSADLTT